MLNTFQIIVIFAIQHEDAVAKNVGTIVSCPSHYGDGMNDIQLKIKRYCLSYFLASKNTRASTTNICVKYLACEIDDTHSNIPIPGL